VLVVDWRRMKIEMIVLEIKRDGKMGERGSPPA